MRNAAAKTAWAVLLVSGMAAAQSPALLEALRVHDPDASTRARKELATCELGACKELPALTLLVASLDLAEGDAATAKKLLAARPIQGLLAPYAAYYLGQAAFYTQDFPAAAAAFARAADEGPPQLMNRSRARQAEAYLEKGETALALPLLEDVLTQVTTPELLLERGRARKALGNLPGARADFHALLVHYPLSPASEEAVLELRALPGPPLRLGLDERLGRAKAFLDGGAFAASEGELTELEREKQARGKVAEGRVALARLALDYARNLDAGSEAHLKKALEGASSTAAEALLMKARRKMKGNGPRPEAQKLMSDLERRFPREAAGEEAGYLSGWLLLQQEKYPQAAAVFEGFEARHPHARKRDEAAWYEAYALLRAQRYAEARAVLDSFAGRFPRSSLVPQTRYWSLRCRQLLGEKELGQGFSELLQQNPGSFYALLSAERLRELGLTPPPAFPSKLHLRPAAELPELALARALDAAGLLKDAADEVQRRVGSVHSVPAALELGSALERLDEPGAAYALAARLLWGEAFTQRVPEALALLYPRAYAPTVDRESRSAGVNPFLLWAIMRRESAFRPNLVSGANARGLMQLIPPTAVAIAKSRKEEAPSADALYAPAVNLNLSAWYVGELVKRFVHPVLVSAAYNAGPTVVAKWASQNQQLPVDLFVEAIPYKETRGYVKQVVADTWLYQSFYGGAGDTARLALQVPIVSPDGISF